MSNSPSSPLMSFSIGMMKLGLGLMLATFCLFALAVVVLIFLAAIGAL